jgi:hypothetical protein
MTVVFTKTLPDAELPLAVGESMRLEFGQLQLDILHSPFEWTLRYRYRNKLAQQHTAEYGPETVLRFVFDKSEKTVSVTALLADRAVVSRPLSPISLMAGASTQVYISTPLYLAVNIGSHRLIELPVVRLSDTWFGDKSSGELCYSDTTRARLDPSAVENLYFKAVTPVTIKNQSSRQLLLDRINVPVLMLQLFRMPGPDKSFITTSITVTLSESVEDTRIQLGSAQDHRDAELISPARRPQKKQFLYRAIDLFLS